MKYAHLLFLLIFPFASLLAQTPTSDTLGNHQDFNNIESTDQMREEASVLEMLEKVSNITYFRNVYLDMDSTLYNPYNYETYEVPTFPDSVYAQRIAALASQTTIPLTYNAHVRSYIDLYAMRCRQQSSRMLGLSYVYFPMFEECLAKYNIPLELKYLAMVESALNPTAGSYAGAKGLWQFMPTTGKYFDLKLTSLVDERYDPMKETEAACRYLQSLYARYEDWFLVLAAYNAGPGTVNKALLRAGNVKNYWALWPYLPAETRGYVPAFIAVTYVMSYASAHNIYPMNPGLLLHGTDTVMVHNRLSFDVINECVGVPMEDMEFFNPQYTKKIVPGTKDEPYALRLPMKYALRFVQIEDSICARQAKADAARPVVEDKPVSVPTSFVHVVKKGESLSSIARKYQVTVANLKYWNHLKRETLYVGQRLTIYRSGGAPAVQSSTSTNQKTNTSSAATTTKTHVVRKNETLSSIANKYGCTVADLKRWNGLKSSTVYVGQKIKIKK